MERAIYNLQSTGLATPARISRTPLVRFKWSIGWAVLPLICSFLQPLLLCRKPQGQQKKLSSMSTIQTGNIRQDLLWGGDAYHCSLLDLLLRPQAGPRQTVLFPFLHGYPFPFPFTLARGRHCVTLFPSLCLRFYHYAVFEITATYFRVFVVTTLLCLIGFSLLMSASRDEEQHSSAEASTVTSLEQSDKQAVTAQRRRRIPRVVQRPFIIIVAAAFITIALALGLGLGLGLRHQHKSTGPLVDLGYAKYEGRSHDGVNEWLRLRYAAAPTGQLRFAAPQPPIPMEETQSATRVGGYCPFINDYEQRLTLSSVVANVFPSVERLPIVHRHPGIVKTAFFSRYMRLPMHPQAPISQCTSSYQVVDLSKFPASIMVLPWSKRVICGLWWLL